MQSSLYYLSVCARVAACVCIPVYALFVCRLGKVVVMAACVCVRVRVCCIQFHQSVARHIHCTHTDKFTDTHIHTHTPTLVLSLFRALCGCAHV